MKSIAGVKLSCRPLRMLPVFVLALGGLIAGAQSANAQNGNGRSLPAGMGLNVASYQDARFCEKVGFAFQDEAMEKRWGAIARAIADAPGLPSNELEDVDYEIDMSGPGGWIIADPKEAGTSKTAKKYRAHYDRCRAGLQTLNEARQ